MNEEFIFEEGSNLAGKIIDILKIRDCNELFMAQFADIPKGLSEKEAETWLINMFGERRLKDLVLYTEDSYLPLSGAPGSRTKLCMERDGWDDEVICTLSRAFPKETILLRYYGESTVPFWETYTVKAGEIAFSGFEDELKYSIFLAHDNFRETYSSLTAEERNHGIYLYGTSEFNVPIVDNIEDLKFEIEDRLNRYPGKGLIITTEQEVFFKDEDGNEKSRHDRRRYYTEKPGEFFELNDETAELLPIEEDDFIPELPEKNKFTPGRYFNDDKAGHNGKRPVYNEWHRQEMYTPTNLEIIIPDCTEALHKELYEEFHKETYYGYDSSDFHYRNELYKCEYEEEKLEDYLIKKSWEYPDDEIWISFTHGSELARISHIRKGRLHEIDNTGTEVNLDIPSDAPLAKYLEKVFADKSYLKRRFKCSGEMNRNKSKNKNHVSFSFDCPISLSTGIDSNHEIYPIGNHISVSTSLGTDVPLYTFSPVGKRERRLALDVLFCPAVLTYPAIYREKLSKGHSPDSVKFQEDLANDGAMMPMTDGTADTVRELLMKTESIRHEVPDEFPSILLDITRRRDSVRREKHIYLFSPDYDRWFTMNKYNGELREIDIMKYFLKY